MIKKIAFTMYPVADIDRARNFYENTLNIKVGKVHKHPDGTWVEYDLPEGGCLALTDLAEGMKPSADSGGSVAFEVEDLDKMLAKLRAKNIPVVLEKFTTEVCSFAVILDSEGNAITLHQLKRK